MLYQIIDGYIPDIGIAIIPLALFQYLPGIVPVIGIGDRRGIATGKIQGPEVRAQPGFHIRRRRSVDRIAQQDGFSPFSGFLVNDKKLVLDGRRSVGAEDEKGFIRSYYGIHVPKIARSAEGDKFGLPELSIAPCRPVNMEPAGVGKGAHEVEAAIGCDCRRKDR